MKPGLLVSMPTLSRPMLAVLGAMPMDMSTLSALRVCTLSSFRFLTVTVTPSTPTSTFSVRWLVRRLTPLFLKALATSAATSLSSRGRTWSSISITVTSAP